MEPMPRNISAGSVSKKSGSRRGQISGFKLILEIPRLSLPAVQQHSG